MAIKIENRSGDDVVLNFLSQDIELADGEDISFENSESNEYSIVVNRKRIPQELQEDKPRKKFSIYEEDSKPASHIQLKYSADFETISSKAVITIEENVKMFDTLHEDVLFAGYKLGVSGAKILRGKDSFATEKIKKEYLSKQIKGAVFPVGIVGFIVMIIGIYCLLSALDGTLVKIFQNEITKGSASLVTVGGIAVFGVFISNMIKILKRAKELN